MTGTEAQRRAAGDRVAAYHEARLAELVAHVAAAIDSYRAAEIDAYEVDETIHQYHRAARKLWVFCWSAGAGAHLESVAAIIETVDAGGEPIDWWQRGAPPRRGH